MLYVHLVGSVKENKLIKMQGLNNFKMGSAPGKRWVLEISGYAVVEWTTHQPLSQYSQSHHVQTAVSCSYHWNWYLDCSYWRLHWSLNHKPRHEFVKLPQHSEGYFHVP